MTPHPGKLTEAVAERLATVTADGSQVEVHIVDVAAGADGLYYVVTPSPGGMLDGPLAHPNDDGDLVTLVTSSAPLQPGSHSALQCLYLQNEARLALLEGLAVDGHTVMRVRLDVPGGVSIDRDPDPHRFFAVDRFVTSLTL